ncbi:urea ABC transporter permease subunit UrtB [Agarivorans gilvus]|uniref:Branched-chain amino acid ABC transporter permease n=1 Tax=Agarivorans gilvus TaxID=680279 RepID=A0ABQ1I8Z4_9ALTE|nr:urea ABC transporter permease subunit UrtB [Agarivorans gilvus]GGB20401.1 branched-chain amino acid ABC transporter permease [Agarivorans gilvus]
MSIYISRLSHLWLSALLLLIALPAAASDWNQVVQAFASAKNNNQKEVLIEQLIDIDDERNQLIFQSLLDANLYYRKSDRLVVVAIEKDGQYQLSSVLDGSELGAVSKSKIRKITVNNSIRRQLRSGLAQISLSAADPAERIAAVRSLMNEADESFMPMIEKRLVAESDKAVIAKLKEMQAIIVLQNGEPQARIAAAQLLSGQLDQASRNVLNQQQAKEQDPQVLAAIDKAVATNQQLVQINGIAENIYFGLSLGAVLLLAAVGLAITFGVMGVINMAHGEMIMLGAYTTYVIQQLMPNSIEWSLLVAVPAAFVVSGLVGVLIERGIIRFLYGRPLETLLATFGLSLILQQAVRSIFGPLNQAVITPQWMSGSLEINGVLSLTYNRLYIIVFSFLVVALLWTILRKTFFGLQMRAVTQNRAMANSMGIRSSWVDAMTFGLGSGIAGIAGVALSQLTNVGPNLGQNYIIDSFMVVVFGGVGNLFGTVIGALTLGVANKLAEPFTGAVLAKILVLVFIILFIQKRPRGLFALKGRTVED